MRVWVYRLFCESKWRLSIAWQVDQYYWNKKGQSIDKWLSFSSIAQAKAWMSNPKQKKNAPFIQLSSACTHSLCWSELERDAEVLLYQLEGRALLWNEIMALIHKRRLLFSREWLLFLLQRIYLDGKCEILPGIDLEGPESKWRCLRCHASIHHLRKSNCASCEKSCVYCEHCIRLGRARSCTLLIRVPKIRFTDSPMRREFDIQGQSNRLTEEQQRASEEIESFLASNSQRLLVWAVTGAGKTEIMMPSVRRMLAEQKHICWVTPRTEVVHELKPRLEKALSPTSILSLYGGSPQLWEKGTMVLATAHQMWRYYRWFDVAIIDEVDAFPLYGNHSLEKGVELSLLPHAQVIFLTATPPDAWLRDIRNGRLKTVIVPVRYHGHPLPEPKYVRTWWLWRKLRSGKPLPVFSQFLKQVKSHDGQAFLFVPRIQDIAAVLNWLKRREPQWGEVSAGVYSDDPQRKTHIEAFKKGKLKVLITTTIMERGVTIPSSHVLVIGSDHPVFTRASLIQIAGRVGRHASEQRGQVWFWAEANTKAQQSAIEEIRWLNHHAQKKGIFHKGDGSG